MREGFIDVVEANPFRSVVSFDRLQTGDVTQERWSRQTPENDYRVIAAKQRAQAVFLAVSIEHRYIGHRLSDIGGCCGKAILDDLSAA